jgi:ankyrin repeat protein
MAESRNENGRPPPSYAAEEGQADVVRLLLAREDVVSDSRGNDGQTPLSWAVAIHPTFDYAKGTTVLRLLLA